MSISDLSHSCVPPWRVNNSWYHSHSIADEGKNSVHEIHTKLSGGLWYQKFLSHSKEAVIVVQWHYKSEL